MLISRFVTAAVLSASTLGLVGAGVPQEPPCSLGTKYPVSSVASYSTRETAGITPHERFRGAEIVVPAEPGVTQEWLQRTLQSEIASGVCDFGSRNVEVETI